MYIWRIKSVPLQPLFVTRNGVAGKRAESPEGVGRVSVFMIFGLVNKHQSYTPCATHVKAACRCLRARPL
jgi:hypothetical protein